MKVICKSPIYENITVLVGECLEVVDIDECYILLKLDRREEYIALSIDDRRIDIQWET